MVRGADDKIRLFHNACRHRGAMVCRERSGNAKHFTCFYHYWTYDNDGKLSGVPDAGSYGPGFAQSEMGLYPVRYESYRGWIFVCFSRDSMGLVDYLAEARDLLDMILDQDEAGSVILPGAHEYSMRANWKMLMENTVDIYHLNSTHSRFMRDYLPHVLGLKTPDPRTVNDGATSPRGLGNGHAVIEYRKFSGVADEAKRKAWQEKFGVEPSKVVEVQALAGDSTDRIGRFPEKISGSGFFQGFLRGAFRGRVSRQRPTLGHDPALGVAGGDQQDFQHVAGFAPGERGILNVCDRCCGAAHALAVTSQNQTECPTG